MHLFADDTEIYTSNATKSVTKRFLWCSFARCQRWFSSNELLRNKNKSQRYIFIFSQRNIPRTGDLPGISGYVNGALLLSVAMNIKSAYLNILLCLKRCFLCPGRGKIHAQSCNCLYCIMLTFAITEPIQHNQSTPSFRTQSPTDLFLSVPFTTSLLDLYIYIKKKTFSHGYQLMNFFIIIVTFPKRQRALEQTQGHHWANCLIKLGEEVMLRLNVNVGNLECRKGRRLYLGAKRTSRVFFTWPRPTLSIKSEIWVSTLWLILEKPNCQRKTHNPATMPWSC